MSLDQPFVVTVASEKGGVGKTTVATNLAVYLKALREDLPVTVASFDNHFTVDSMFAIGGRRPRSVAALFEGAPASALPEMGEYGVQFLASAHALSPPDDDLYRLRRALTASPLPGVLVLDTRPVLDYFTRNALLAADLVLVPVKDRPSLMNAASLHRVLLDGEGDAGKIWLLPSLIDRRLRLRGEMGMAEFLSLAARERGYQVMETSLSKSPRVEGLTTGFSTRVHPVLTHACGTAVHRELRQIAEFVLQRRDEAPGGRDLPASPGDAASPLRRQPAEVCPACGLPSAEKERYFYEALRGRTSGFVHSSCIAPLLEAEGIPHPPEAQGQLAMALEGAGFSGPEPEVAWVLADFRGEKKEGGRFHPDPAFTVLLERAVGRSLAEIGREGVLIALAPGSPERFLAGEERSRWKSLRRAALREAVAG